MTQFSVLLAVTVGGLFLIFLFVRAGIRRALDAEGLKDKLREEIGQLVRDLNQTTDRNISLIEDAVRALKEAVAEADRRVEVLRRESERRAQEQAVYDRLGRLRASASAEAERSVTRQDPGAAEAAFSGRTSPLPAAPVRAEAPVPKDGPEPRTPSIPFVTFSSTPLRSKPPLKEEVLSLNRRGISADFIAAKLGITVAEVELIISLEEQRGLAGREDRP